MNLNALVISIGARGSVNEGANNNGFHKMKGFLLVKLSNY